MTEKWRNILYEDFLDGGYVFPRIFRKFFFRQTYSNEISIDAVFDGDYESAIIFRINIYINNENRIIRVHFRP